MLFGVEMFEGLMAYGYVGIIVYMILTGCGLPMPEEVAIIAGGVLAANGQLHWGLTLGSLLIGAIIGDSVMYFIGHHFGRRLLHGRSWWNRLITPDREKKVEQLIAQHGVKVLFVTRFLVGLRGPMYITAGILKMPYKKFLLADIVCATIVVTLFFAASYWYGAAIAKAIHDGEQTLTVIVVAVAAVAGVGVLWWYLSHKKLLAKAGENGPPAMHTDEPPKKAAESVKESTETPGSI